MCFSFEFHKQIIGVSAVVLYSGDIVKELLPSIFYYYTVILYTFGLIWVLFGLKLVEKFGRAFLMQVGSVSVSVLIFLILIGVNFLLGDNGSKWIIIISVILFRGTFSCTLSPIYWIYMSEIVKPNIIPYGTLINEIGSSMVIFVFPILCRKIRWFWMDFYLQLFIMCNINYHQLFHFSRV